MQVSTQASAAVIGGYHTSRRRTAVRGASRIGLGPVGSRPAGVLRPALERHIPIGALVLRAVRLDDEHRGWWQLAHPGQDGRRGGNDRVPAQAADPRSCRQGCRRLTAPARRRSSVGRPGRSGRGWTGAGGRGRSRLAPRCPRCPVLGPPRLRSSALSRRDPASRYRSVARRSSRTSWSGAKGRTCGLSSSPTRSSLRHFAIRRRSSARPGHDRRADRPAQRRA